MNILREDKTCPATHDSHNVANSDDVADRQCPRRHHAGDRSKGFTNIGDVRSRARRHLSELSQAVQFEQHCHRGNNNRQWARNSCSCSYRSERKEKTHRGSGVPERYSEDVHRTQRVLSQPSRLDRWPYIFGHYNSPLLPLGSHYSSNESKLYPLTNYCPRQSPRSLLPLLSFTSARRSVAVAWCATKPSCSEITATGSPRALVALRSVR